MRKIIIGNWKMNPASQQEAMELFETVKKGLQDVKNAKVVICPPFVYLAELKGMTLGAQNTTDEFSPKILKNMGVEYVILGHSDVRKNAAETNEIINKKMKECLQENLVPVLCIGEQEGKNKLEVLEWQIGGAFAGISKENIERVIIAYEPVWAIGTGNNCTIEETQASVILIKKIVTGLYDENVAGTAKILYGGSVDSKNSADYLKNGEVDGLLVGGASLDAQEFVAIVSSVL